MAKGLMACAFRKKGYPVIHWVPEDIVSAYANSGREVTKAAATDWLLKNAGHIEDRSVELGWEVIDTLLGLDPIGKAR